MNLFKQQKFSIRKFNVGIFSALIATVAFLGVNTNSAEASEVENGVANNQVDNAVVNQEQTNNVDSQFSDTNQVVDPNVNQATTENNNQDATTENINNPVVNSGEGVSNQDNTTTNDEVNTPAVEVVQPAVSLDDLQTPKLPTELNNDNQNSKVPTEGLNKPVATVETNQSPKKRSKRDVGDSTNDNNVVANNQVDNAQNQTLNNAKQVATNEINQKATEKNQSINTTAEATQEEKQVALTDVEHQQFNANNNIQQAASENDVTTAKNNGLTAIDNITVQTHAKEAARNAIVQKVADQILNINNNQNATNEEKAEAVNQVHNVEHQALKNINGANTQDEINNIQNQNVTSIGKVEPTTTVKPTAISEVNQAATEHNSTIDGNSGATTEEKAKAKEKVNGLVGITTYNINQSSSNQEVNQAKEFGINQINAITPETAVKDSANDEINQAAQQQKENNNNNYADATTEEKTEANNLVDSLANEAHTDIAAANTTDEVNNVKNNTVQALQNASTVVAKKPAARDQINQALSDRKQAINNSNQSTTEEKADAINQLDPKKAEIDNNINQATTNGEVSTAVTNGLNELNNIEPATVKKQQAKTTIAQDADNQKQLINQDTNSTTEEHDAANAKIDQAVAKANNDIDQAATNNDVDNAVATNQTEINQIQQDAQVKPAAKAEIAQKVTEQETVIQATRGTTTEEINEALQALQTAKTQADQAIDAAQSNADVENVKNEEIAKITSILPSQEYKNNAMAEIENLGEQRKVELTQNPDMTKEERDDTVDSVDRAVGQGTNNVYQALSKQSVDNAKNDAITNINQVRAFVNVKQDARDAISQIAEQRKQTFPNDVHATDEEKQEASNNVDAIVTKANEQINQATTDAQVAQVKNQAIQDIDLVVPQSNAKTTALSNIQTKQEQQTYIINNEPNATSEEKAIALQELNQAVTNANNEVNAATTNAQVATAEQNGITAISNTLPATQTKGDAKAALDQAATNQKALVGQNQDATTEEKDAANQLIDRALNNAKQSVTDLDSAIDVETKKNEGIDNINQITADTGVKTAVKQDLQNQANAKKQEIANSPLSTEEEKQAANTKVDNALQQGLTDVTNAQSIVDVNNAVKANDETIQAIQPETTVKDNAKKEALNILNQQKDTIYQNANATAEEKQLAGDKLDQLASKVINNINQANTNNDVDQAKTNAITEINQFTPSIVKKENANEELTDTADLKQAELDKSQNNSQEDIDDAKQTVQAILSKAKEQVNQAQTNQQVDEAKANGINALQNVQPIGGLRRDALKEVNDVYNDKVNEIQDAVNGTQEEITATLNNLNNIKAQDDTAINQATNVQQLTTAKDQALSDINGFEFTFTKKADAITEIRDALSAKENSINENNKATSQEKDNAINSAREQANIAFININNADTNQQVDDAVSNGKAEIDQVTPEVVTKPNAIESINQLADQLKETFGQTLGATLDESEEAAQKVDSIVNNANNEIENATSDIDVAQIKANAMNDLNQVVINVEQISNAAKALREEADKVKETIDSNEDAVESEKLAAKENLNNILEKGLAVLNVQNTNEEVANAKSNFIDQIKAIKVDTVVKPRAISEVTKFVNNQVALIQSSTKATTDEKEDAINRVKAIEDESLASIKNANNSNDINEVVENAQLKLGSVNVKAIIKEETIKALDDKIAEQKEKINNSQANQEQKDKALSQLGQLTSKIGEQVDQAQSNEDVLKVKEETIKQIEAIVPKVTQKTPQKDPNQEPVKTPQKDKDNDNDVPTQQTTVTGSNTDEDNTPIKNGENIDEQVTSSTVEQSEENDNNSTSEAKQLPETGQNDSHIPVAGIAFAAGAAIVSRRLSQKKDKSE